ncbi:MAG: 3-isopropylmalate dehydratase large subunit [Chlorobium sp.]|uniref:3-isopropylmalate dehydratase large subunit n=1 Tax=Chlorobium sp. TaxID=1095 RepID=UPI0025BDC5F2|nr:3-isopropylmalate dehydratase large subunit [Chlorobium sp.]MCF8216936.1 3-isopropylmalate dehydratase large subunit [Chlorobium sp.]MCF8271765.1 3-isopropylmalate dehydratase large subunit [Chlorobium sp.]MCF8288153.1 3-isopropylmalate dehydratase large subunit [Chlorobium sp.]MCF8291744.1 3-isopropylmalate dehydratase large subunit [Chlorobium sp.]MCF8385836.1 3-isopropylmalate dehydratase large subunit [Chlorobium sp.]
MAQTITQKILSRAANRKFVDAGENVWLNVDILLTHDVCGPPTFDIFKQEFGPDAKVWDPEKVVVLPDHYIFTANEHARRNIDLLRQFAAQQELPNYYDVGTDRYKGVCHVALAEEGFNIPGTVLFGTDSHTCTSGAFGMFGTGIGNTDAAFILGTGKLWEKVPESMKFTFEGEMPEYLTAKDLILQILGDIGTDGATYRAMEFDGEAVYSLPVEERMTLTNMAIEAGGMNGIIAADAVTEAYVQAHSSKPYEVFHSDPNALYHSVRRYNVRDMEPVVAQPHSPDNRATVRSVQGTKITKSYIGSCTGGKLTDFMLAAKILKGKQVTVPTNIVPATVKVARDLETETYEGVTLKKIFEDAGCSIALPSCAACLGGPADTVGRSVDYDVVVSTTNRNFPGRMGSKKAGVYLASPLTAAASAVTGKLTDPRDFL